MATKTITITAENVAKLEAAGFKRWTKSGYDRLYIDTRNLGLEIEYRKTGSVLYAKWQGEDISKADGSRIYGSKVYIDVKTGELHVESSFWQYDMPTVEDKALELMDAIFAPEPEPEPEEDEGEDDDAKTFESMKNVIDYVEQSVHYAEDYDIEAIAQEVTRFVDGKLVITVDGEDYWEVVYRHEKSGDTEECGEYVTIERPASEVEVKHLDEFSRHDVFTMSKFAYDRLQRVHLSYDSVEYWFTHDYFGRQHFYRRFDNINFSHDTNMALAVVYDNTFANTFLDEMERGSSRDEAFVHAIDAAERTYALNIRYLASMISELEQELDEE